MLRELRIRDFAVVEELVLEFGDGLNVLTGETGAGKSILVEALGLLVGGRPSSDMIRAGEDKAVVEGRFEVAAGSPLALLCEEAGVELDDDWLILRRELRREGRNRVWTNASPGTTTLLREIGSRLLDLHGQHEHQRLLARSEQRAILDAFGGHGGLARDVTEAHDRLEEARDTLAKLRSKVREGRERADYLRFKAREIEAARLEADEEERLDTEARRLAHSEELLALSGTLNEGLYESDGAVVDRLGELGSRLRELVRIDESGRPFLELHESALRTLEELGRELGRYRDGVEHDPGRLAEVRDRLDEIYRLKRKYGDSVEEVIAAGAEARSELAEIETSDERIVELEREIGEGEAELAGLAERLTAARTEAAAALEDSVAGSLPALGLGGGEFRIAIEPRDAIARSGADRIEFRVSLNPGFPPGPLSRVASGGEMSRLMLALETALAGVNETPILVFDEIDAGIGGEIAHRVAERLADVARSHQVLVVTHLAQIAARADAHFAVGKHATDRTTRAHVEVLERDGRVEELARMLGGDPESATSRAHAEELLG